ncbi:DNA primase [Streptomyces thermospinosisporus]
MNRMGLGLAIGAGYLLGRTKKLKMAVAVGGLVAGKKLNLGPRMVADLLSQQLRDNPQFKEIGDQLRGDLRGVGKAASGALVERQLGAVADRLHGRTAALREEVAGGGTGDGDDRDERDEEPAEEYDDEQEAREPDDSADDAEEAEESADERAPARKAPARKAAQKPPAKKAAKKAPAKKAPAKKAPGKKAAATKKAAARRTTAAKKTAAPRGGRSGSAKGGGER